MQVKTFFAFAKEDLFSLVFEEKIVQICKSRPKEGVPL